MRGWRERRRSPILAFVNLELRDIIGGSHFGRWRRRIEGSLGVHSDWEDGLSCIASIARLQNVHSSNCSLCKSHSLCKSFTCY